jgi:(R,R)-butanediol dehydrogenase/meso-butanediol dehydrogenase/diacetyl reductase
MTAMGEPLAVTDVPDPTPGPGDVVVAVAACGICGSDLHAAAHLPLDGTVFGHEFSGTVAEVRATANSDMPWVPGDRVVGLSLATCGVCPACRAGRVRKCPHAQMIGFDRPGAYADYVALPAHNLVRLPGNLDHRHGALAEPLAVARRAVRRAEVGPDTPVVVLGAGPVGLAVTAWLARLGVTTIVASDPSPTRRHAALAMGATAVVDPDAGPLDEGLVELCGGAPTRIIECVGVPGLLQDAVNLAAVDAVVSVAGVCMVPEEFTALVAMVKELDLRFSFFYERRDVLEALEAMAGGWEEPLAMVTGEVSLDALPQRFEELRSPGSDCKVLVRPSS